MRARRRPEQRPDVARIQTIDINCDCGESFGNWALGADDALLPIITTANVACGFHGGDPLVMQRTVATAAKHNVSVGAHPGLPDLAGFGRRKMDITPDEAYALVVYQVGALKAFLEAGGMKLHHVKPHGALYVMLHDQEEVAAAVARAIVDTCPNPMLYWPAPVELHALPRAAKKLGIDVVGEVYFDLLYDDQARLIVERKKTAKDPADVAARVRRFVREGVVATVTGKVIPIEARTVCIHGDGPNSLEIAETVISVLREEGVSIAAAHAASRTRGSAE
jgi:5-oxoprolinase (ATP-hydrolysing) subunit A